MAKLGFLLLIVLYVCWTVFAGSGCPPSSDIEPCVCYNSPHTILECTNIQTDEVLKGVFERSKEYNYKEFHLYFSTLKYLPKELFENTGVQEIHLQNSTLNALFDSPPDGLSNLRKLHLENTKIVEISHWELLNSLTHLKILTVYYNTIESIDSRFGEYITHDLEHINFYATGTKRITPGALVPFSKLDKIAVDNCNLREISRDIFPTPSDIRDIYFNGNEISVVPDDMFTDMPKLRTVGLRENLLVTIPEAAFGGNIGKLTYLFLEGNPIKCSCSLLWLFNNQPDYVGGSCAVPIRLHDKLLRDIAPRDLKC